MVTLPRAPPGEEFSQLGQLWWGIVRHWGLRHGGEWEQRVCTQWNHWHMAVSVQFLDCIVEYKWYKMIYSVRFMLQWQLPSYEYYSRNEMFFLCSQVWRGQKTVDWCDQRNALRSRSFLRVHASECSQNAQTVTQHGLSFYCSRQAKSAMLVYNFI